MRRRFVARASLFAVVAAAAALTPMALAVQKKAPFPAPVGGAK